MSDILDEENAVKKDETVETVDEISASVNTEQTVEPDEVVMSEEEKQIARRNALNHVDTKARWYALHVFSGYEQVVKKYLEERVIEKYSLQNRIFDIVIPMEDVIEEKNGKRKLINRKMFPGYVLIKMIYGDDLWHAITRTPGVTAFCGAKGRAEAMLDEEVKKLKLETIKVEIDLNVGDKVEIMDGPLVTMIGEVVTIDMANQKCRVNVNMFGRDMPIDLDFIQIRKI